MSDLQTANTINFSSDELSLGDIPAINADELKSPKTDKPSRQIQKKTEEFAIIWNKMKQASTDIDDIGELLTLILPALELMLEENCFRYLLGILCWHSALTQKEIAACAGCSDKRVRKGKKEYTAGIPTFDRARKKGGGRKKKTAHNSQILPTIKNFIENTICGACTQSLRQYASSTLESIQKELGKLNIKASLTTISSILKENGIRKNKNRKIMCCSRKDLTPRQKEIRDAQFAFINEMKKKCLELAIVPMLSIDCKRKEVLGAFASRGACYVEAGKSVPVMDHDFMVPLNVATLTGMDDLITRQEGKAVPFGILDVKMNKGYLYVGISSDTAEFVADALECELKKILKDYPDAPYIVVFADGGGSNGARSRNFKYQMAMLSDRLGIPIYIIHYPPYKSKYNPIERLMFAPLSHVFEGHPLYNLKELLNLARAAKTRKGLTVDVDLNIGIYETGRKVTEEEFNSILIEYTGPTKDESTHLSYIIRGTADKRGLNDRPPRKTVFDLKENIDKTKEEKEAVKKAKAEEKAAREAKKASKPQNGRKKKKPSKKSQTAAA